MAAKSQPDKRRNRQRILFSFNVDLESPLGVVFQYLMRNPQLPSRLGKQKGVEAMAAFWRPFAYQKLGQASEEELKDMARESLEALRRQMELISQTFEVELPPSEEPSPVLEETLERTLDKVLQKYMASGGLARQPHPETMPNSGVTSTDPLLSAPGEAGIGFDPKALFGDVFSEDEFAM